MDKVSRIQRSVSEFDTVISEINELKEEFIQSANLGYNFHSALDNFNDFETLKSSFPVAPSGQVRFKLETSAPLHTLILTKNYQKVCLFNQKNGDSNRYLHYQMEILKEQQRCMLRIGLSCLEFRQKSMDDLVKLITHLVHRKLLFMTQLEIEDFANCILEINSDAFSGISAFKDQFEVLTVPDFKPVGGIHFVPSIITLDFSEKHVTSFGGFEKMSVAFLEAMDSFFAEQQYVVKGTILSGNTSILSKEIKEISYQTVRIPVNFSISDKQLRNFSATWNTIHGNRKRLELRNFAWKNTDPSHTMNKISIVPSKDKNGLEIITEYDSRISPEVKDQLKNVVARDLVFGSAQTT